MKKKIVKKKSVVSKKKHKGEYRGMSKLLPIAIVVVVLMAGTGLYVFSQNGGIVPAGSIIKTPLNPNCKHNDPDLCKFLNNWNQKTSYSASSTSTAEGVTTKSIMELQGDKFRMVSYDGNNKENYQMISIDNTTYTKDYSDNKWWKMTTKPDDKSGESTEIRNSFKFDEETEQAEDTTKYNKLGQEDCGGKSCFKYEIVDSSSGDYKQYIWFDNKEYLLQKVEMVSGDGSKSITEFSYTNPSINVPSPVKEGEPAYGAGASQEDINKMIQQYQDAGSSTEEIQESYFQDPSAGE